jgi:hypothetical protein
MPCFKILVRFPNHASLMLIYASSPRASRCAFELSSQDLDRRCPEYLGIRDGSVFGNPSF